MAAMSSALARMLALTIVATMLVPAVALADGDPASDVLLGESVFYPYSPPVATGLQKTLNAETAAGTRAHFPIKVALIDTPVDLGAIPTLFGKPQQYADFLHQEISFLGAQAAPARRDAQRLRRSGAGPFSNRRRRDAKTTDGLGEQRPRAGGHRRGAEARRGRRPSDQRRCRSTEHEHEREPRRD